LGEVGARYALPGKRRKIFKRWNLEDLMRVGKRLILDRQIDIIDVWIRAIRRRRL
jgi:hypothetical protein